MNRKKIAILGATGLLGTPLSKYLIEQGYAVTRQGFRRDANYQVDLRIPGETMAFLDMAKPDLIVNLVALTDVDLCEADSNLAYLMNVRPIENMLPWLKLHENVGLVQISTDHLYDGIGPHSEANVTIRNIYALSKYCAEHVALRANACVFRTNFFGKSLVPGRQSFSDWLIDSLTTKRQIQLFTDVYFSPLSMKTLLKMISFAIENFKPGIYNLGSRNGMSKRDFSHLLADQFSLDISRAADALSTDTAFKAARPKDMRMDSALFQKTFQVVLPELSEEIKSLRSDYAR